MGHIRKEELHESLINELEELGNIDLSGKQDKTDESLLTESKDLVGAINELFQSANNGKELIANAIGEPLNAEDTFSAMSDKINEIKDDLKQILTEEGVSVTEEDDMASLISKVDEEFDRQVVPAGDAVAANVLSGKTFINNTGQTVTGTMVNRGGAQTVTPGTSNKTLSAGYYSGNITIAGDADLKAANIKSGVNIFGVTGTATAASLGGKTVKTGTYTIPSEVGKGSGESGDFYITVTADFGNVKPSRLFVFPSYLYARGTPHKYAVLDSSRHTTYSDSGATCILSEAGDTAWISGVTTTGFTVGFWKGGSNGYYTVSGTLGWLAIF